MQHLLALGWKAIKGGAGDDEIHSQGGQQGTIADGGDGDDYISSVAHTKITGGAGNDKISGGGKHVIDGDGGNDEVMVSGNNNTITGEGNDRIRLWSDNNVVNYSIGDGKDRIEILKGLGNTLKLGEGLTYEDMRISYEGNKANISFEGHGDEEITVDFLREASLSIEFADGKSISINAKPISSSPHIKEFTDNLGR